MSYWPPIENLPTFDVTVFRDAQDVVDFAVATGTANNISGGVAGDLLYQSAPSTTAKLAIGLNTYVLTSNGSIPTWSATYIKSTATSVTPYFLVGSSSSTTSNDATLYKNVNVYVNPATGGIICNDFNILNANSEAFNSSFISLSQFEFRNNSSSTPNTTVFYNNNSVGTPRAVLTLNGNAGVSSFDGLSAASTTVAVADDNTAGTFFPIFASTGTGQKSLLFDSTTTPLSYTPSTSTLIASTFVGVLTGLASSATTVAVADNDTATTMYPIFCTATAGQKSLLFDSTTTPLSYAPSTGDLAAVQFCCGILSPVAGNNAGILVQNTGSSATVVQNQSTSGFIHLGVRDAANALSNAIILSTSDCTITTTNSPVISARNVVVDNASGVPITIGNGSSTSTSNIIITSLSLASTRNFTTGGNVIIGSVAGNSLPVGATDNTFVGDTSGGTTTGSKNICIGYNSQVPTVANSNQIAIGTVAETMYIRGGFNLRVGTQITNNATGNLSAAVLAQFYTVAMSAASQTILLPTPTTAAYLGATVTFKRKTNTTVFTLTAGAGTPFIPINSITAALSISVGATVFQVQLVCDGVNWLSISQA